MRKFLGTLLIPLAIFLTGCQTLEDASNSLNYVSEAKNYIDDLNQFANELPAITEAAVTDVHSNTQLEELLNDMQSQIEAFNVLDAPSMLEDIHTQIVDQNKNLIHDIEVYLENIKAGTLSSELLTDIGLLEAVSVYNDLLNQLIEINE